MKQANFKPSKKLVGIAEAVFLTQANVNRLTPIVTGYQEEILAKHKWNVAPDFYQDMPENERVVLKPCNSYLLSEEDFAVYSAECNAAGKAAGLIFEPEKCPLLVAQHELTKCENALLKEIAKEIPRVKGIENAILGGIDEYRQAVKLTLGLLAPFVKDADKILSDAIKAYKA